MTLPLPDGNISPDSSKELSEDYDAKEITEKLNGIQRNFDALASTFPLTTNNVGRVPQVRVWRSTSQLLATGTLTPITFDTEIYDYYPAGFTEQHSTSANTERLTCRVPGLYSIGGSVTWDNNAVGQRQLNLRVNGTDVFAVTLNAATGFQTDSINSHYRLAVGDYVELLAWQTSGGNLNAATSGAVADPYSPAFYMAWISP